VMPQDVDSFLASRSGATASPKSSGETGFKDVPLNPRQRTLVYRLQQATRDVIPATMEVLLDWSPIEEDRARLKAIESGPPPSQFLHFAWCVAQAARSHPRFRSALLNDTT